MADENNEYFLAQLILRLSNRIVKNRNNHVRALGLTAEQADALQFFYANKNATIKDFQDFISVSHQTAQGIVSRMEEKCAEWEKR